MILITGATGTVGQHVVTELAGLDVPVRALVRDPESVPFPREERIEVVQGDFSNPQTLRAAMEGIEGVFVLLPPGSQMTGYNENLVAAAQECGIQHLVKLSAERSSLDAPPGLGRWHAETEHHIEESGIPYTHLRATYFMQNTLGFADTIKREGKFYASMGDGTVSMIDARDIATVAARVLTEDGHENTAYLLTGPEALSFGDVADTFSSVLDREVTYVDLPGDELRERLIDAGMPEWGVNGLVGIYESYRHGNAPSTVDTVQRITDRQPRTFETFATDYRDAFTED